MGVDQSRLIKAVAAHHAADGVGKQTLDVLLAVWLIERDLVIGDFGGEFILKAVCFNEEAVVIFLKCFHSRTR